MKLIFRNEKEEKFWMEVFIANERHEGRRDNYSSDSKSKADHAIMYLRERQVLNEEEINAEVLKQEKLLQENDIKIKQMKNDHFLYERDWQDIRKQREQIGAERSSVRHEKELLNKEIKDLELRKKNLATAKGILQESDNYRSKPHVKEIVKTEVVTDMKDSQLMIIGHADGYFSRIV